MKRKRVILVPDDSVECFEVRVALFYESDGSVNIDYAISTPDNPHEWPPLHEVLGVIELLKAALIDQYERDEE